MKVKPKPDNSARVRSAQIAAAAKKLNSAKETYKKQLKKEETGVY